MNARGKRMGRKCPVCGGAFTARVADVARGWGVFCSKRCKAVKQTRERGAAGWVGLDHDEFHGQDTDYVASMGARA